MLKINKILSKKIKFPLSLRGAKRRSNLNKGFSLIELMVAVAILAMAIFGIFHAYSAGFMGMADARDRTVATNYAREAMEDIKNKDFDQIITQSRNYINGTKYEREVIVQPSTNLKKVTTKVYWKDRNGTWKTVETDMVIYFIETTAGDATRIMLYASPYDVLILENEGDTPTAVNKSTITAVIKDAIGNTVVDWDKEITFLLTTGSGSLSSDAISPDNFVNGKAIITFTSSTAEGEEIITASTEGLTPDSVTINVYNPGVPVKINLTADPYSMSPSIGTTSEITATIVDAGGNRVDDATNEINFSRTGPGTLSTPTTTVGGIATINLASNGTPGTITVTASAASADGLEPGVVVVLTGGYIALSASPIEVPKGEESVITVTIKDVNGLPINYDGAIDLVMVGNGGGLGTLFPDPVDFDGSTSSKEVTFTATYEGTVEIVATDTNEILTSDTLILTVIEELTPHHIIVYGMPLSIPVGGTETSLITAKVMTEGNVIITSYNKLITFTTTVGHFYDGSKEIASTDLGVTYEDGVATVELYSSDIPETAEITVSSTVSVEPEHIITGSTEVGFYIGPDHIMLSAEPQNISVGGQTCIVTVKMVDYKGTVISDYNEDIGFSISPWPTTIKFLKATTAFLTQKFKKGITTVILKSGAIAGTAVIVAYSGDLFASLNIPVGISLDLANNIVFNFNEGISTVSFDIDVQGADLLLEEMQVSWDSLVNDTLNKIEIKTPSETGPVITVFDGDLTTPALSGELINFEEVTLSEGTSNVKMYFNVDMSGKTITVIFNPYSGNYSVPVPVPEI